LALDRDAVDRDLELPVGDQVDAVAAFALGEDRLAGGDRDRDAYAIVHKTGRERGVGPINRAIVRQATRGRPHVQVRGLV
jgi:hypothetical protein